MHNLNGKTVVVTGANGLIGTALISKLSEYKSNILAIDIAFKNFDLLDSFKKNLNYEKIIYSSTDILDENDLKKIINESFTKFGSIDGLVNSAAVDFVPNSELEDSVENLNISNFQKILNINVTGQVVSSKIVGNIMKDNDINGSIVNISSIYGKVSPKQEIYKHIKTNSGSYTKPLIYSVSKSALTNMAKYLATYWGEYGIRVNNIVLGGIFNNQDKKFVKNYSKNVPLGRMANINECIEPIIFLLSDKSSYITGSDLIVDGGWTSW